MRLKPYVLKFKRELILLAVVLLTVSIFAKETRDVVIVMDTGLTVNQDSLPYLCESGHVDFSGSGTIDDNNGHGTNIAGLVARGLDTKKQCIVIVKYYDTDKDPYNKQEPGEALDRAWNYLLTTNAKWINMSFVGEVYVQNEYSAIKQLLARGTKVVVAAGNEALNFDDKCERYPACYGFKSPNWYVVGAYDLSLSNFGGPVNIVLQGMNQRGHFGPLMSGSSQATGNATAKIIKGLIK
tara:strand:- start:9429 stop:10145 length:717 start_codon:yes stop_codon:yes gene_type:complete